MPGWQAVLQAAVELRLAPALVARLREKRAARNIPALVLPSGMRTVTAMMETIWREHLERNGVLEDRLIELLVAMNARGLEPVLLKGARSFATGYPQWRSMRDLDLLLLGADAARAHEVALELGYRPAAGSTEKAGKHHFQTLFQDDLPGWLEIHRKAATHRAEDLPPTRLLQAMTVEAAVGATRARILASPAHALHAIVHHHVGHRGDKGGGMDLKGLFEFCADVLAMDGPERAELLALAHRHPRLLAALELWVAAADTAFGLPVAPPLSLYPDATERAARAMARSEEAGARYGGVLEELAFAGDADRLRRLPGGGTMLGRAALRGRTFGSMFRPMIDLFGRFQPDQ